MPTQSFMFLITLMALHCDTSDTLLHSLITTKDDTSVCLSITQNSFKSKLQSLLQFLSHETFNMY